MKIIKVSCELPEGVVVGDLETFVGDRRNFSTSPGRRSVWELFDATMDAAFGREVRTTTTMSSNHSITLTLEVPVDQVGKVAAALRSMLGDLVG